MFFYIKVGRKVFITRTNDQIIYADRQFKLFKMSIDHIRADFKYRLIKTWLTSNSMSYVFFFNLISTQYVILIK